MRGRLAWLLGLAGLIALLRRRRTARPRHAVTAAGSPADELRRKLDESRELVGEQDDFASAETPVDLDDRRRQVHESGRAALDEMRREDE